MSSTIPPEADNIAGQVYRDNDPRSPRRLIVVQGAPDEKNRVPVTDNRGLKTKIRVDRLRSSAYTRCPELER